MIVYDKKRKQLIEFKTLATSNFWDNVFDKTYFYKNINSKIKDRFVNKYTKKFLKKGSKILEGGCGPCYKLISLKNQGFDVYGVDFAKKTINKVKALFPKLRIFVQDVRKLDFPDNFFDGYWSIGVIEHFWEGYESILNEMERVIRPGGFLFLTFPYMSPIRKLKAKVGLYHFWDGTEKENFYQFLLNHKEVIQKFERNNFKMVKSVPFSGLYGLKKDILILRNPINYILNSKNYIFKVFRFLLDRTISLCGGGHCVFYWFLKN